MRRRTKWRRRKIHVINNNKWCMIILSLRLHFLPQIMQPSAHTWLSTSNVNNVYLNGQSFQFLNNVVIGIRFDCISIVSCHLTISNFSTKSSWLIYTRLFTFLKFIISWLCELIIIQYFWSKLIWEIWFRLFVIYFVRPYLKFFYKFFLVKKLIIELVRFS